MDNHLGCVADRVIVTWVMVAKNSRWHNHQSGSLICHHGQLSIPLASCLSSWGLSISDSIEGGLTRRHWPSLANKHIPAWGHMRIAGTGSFYWHGLLKEPNSSRAEKPLFKLASLVIYPKSGLSSGFLRTQFWVELGTRMAQVDSSLSYTQNFGNVWSKLELEFQLV
jgi:hypothetical protein